MPNLRRSSGVAALLRGTFSWGGLRSFAKVEILEDRIWVKVTKATAFQCSRSLSEVLTLPFPQPKTFFRLDFCDRLGLGLLLQWCWWHVENCHLKLASYILRRLTHLRSFKNWQILAEKNCTNQKQWNKFGRYNSLPNTLLSSFQSERRSMKVSEKSAYDSKQVVFSFAAPPQNWATGSKAAKPETNLRWSTTEWCKCICVINSNHNLYTSKRQKKYFATELSKSHEVLAGQRKTSRTWTCQPRPFNRDILQCWPFCWLHFSTCFLKAWNTFILQSSNI